MTASGRLRQFVALRSRRWGDAPRPPAFLFAECLLRGFRYSARGGGLCLFCVDSSHSQRHPESTRMAGVGRLPRLTQFTQSGGWQTRRSPRRSTVGPDREGEQPAITRPSSTERKAVVRTEIANDGHALGVHRITSSARSNSDCGMARPSALAVFTLMHNSNRFGCSMGNSAGLAPLRIREA